MAVRLLYVLLSIFLAGCATVKPLPPEAANLVLPVTNKLVIASCYSKQTTVFSAVEQASKEDFSEFIRKETSTFITELTKKMVAAGFDINTTVFSRGCKVENDKDGRITVVVIFNMISQNFGVSEDMMLTATFIKVPSLTYLVGIKRIAIGGTIRNIKAESAAEDVAPLVIDKIRAAQNGSGAPIEAMTNQADEPSRDVSRTVEKK